MPVRSLPLVKIIKQNFNNLLYENIILLTMTSKPIRYVKI